ncbi:ORF6N domain-containing protein [bacterium]|nr:ORF6N domain-containing protein [bacterium]
MKSILPAERIERIIYLIRRQKVMLDSDLAELYDVPTHRLNEQVKRNKDRFPNDFMFQLSEEEWNNLRSQIASSKRGGRRYMPYVFTEQGVAMLSSVLNSKRAVQVNIEIMRTFVRLRQMLLSNKDLSRRLDELEKKYDTQFKIVFDAIRQLMAPETKPKHRIGFQVGKE